jgi:hypothetical protein
LNAGEWTAYVVNSLDAKTYDLTVRAKAESAPAVFEISVNGNSQEVAANEAGWVEFKLKPVGLVSGANQIKLAITNGMMGFDWMRFQ